MKPFLNNYTWQKKNKIELELAIAWSSGIISPVKPFTLRRTREGWGGEDECHHAPTPEVFLPIFSRAFIVSSCRLYVAVRLFLRYILVSLATISCYGIEIWHHTQVWPTWMKCDGSLMVPAVTRDSSHFILNGQTWVWWTSIKGKPLFLFLFFNWI